MGTSQSADLFKSIEEAFTSEDEKIKELNSSYLSQAEIISMICKKLEDNSKTKEQMKKFREHLMKKEVNMKKEDLDEKEEEKKKQLKQRSEHHLNEGLVAGFENAKTYIEWFNNHEPDDDFQIYNSEVVKDCTKEHIDRAISLLLVFLERKKMLTVSESFFEVLEKHFSGSSQNQTCSTSATTIGIKLGSIFIKQSQREGAATRIEILEHVHDILKELPPLSLYGTDKTGLMLDQALQPMRQTLFSYLHDPLFQNDHSTLNLSLNALFHIALARANVEDLFHLILYIQDADQKQCFQMKQVVKDFVSIQSEGVGTGLGNVFDSSNRISKCSFEALYYEREKRQTSKERMCVVSDHLYLYVYTSFHGLIKVANGIHSGMFGQICKTNPNFHKGDEDTFLILIDNVLYFGSKQVGANKLVKADTTKLEEMTEKFDEEKEKSFFKPEFEEMKERKMEEKETLICQNEKNIMTYTLFESEDVPEEEKEEGEEEEEKKKEKVGIIKFYDPAKDFGVIKSYELKEQDKKLSKIIANGDFLFLIQNDGNYNVYHLGDDKNISSGSEGELKNGPVCFDSDTNSFWILSWTSQDTGLQLMRYKGESLKVGSTEFLTIKMTEIKKHLLGKEEKEKKKSNEIGQLFGLFPLEEEKKDKKKEDKKKEDKKKEDKKKEEKKKEEKKKEDKKDEKEDKKEEKKEEKKEDDSKTEGKEEEEEEKEFIYKEVTKEMQIFYLLGTIAEKAKEALPSINSASLKNASEIIKIFRHPLGIHLTGDSFSLLTELITKYYPYVTSPSETESESHTLYRYSFYYLTIILKMHFQSLSKCQLSLEELFPKDSPQINKIKDMFTKIIQASLDQNIFFKLQSFSLEFYSALQEENLDVFTYGVSFIMKNQIQIISLIEDNLKTLPSNQFNLPFTRVLIQCLSYPQNLHILAEKTFISDNPKLIQLVQYAYDLETQFVQNKLSNFIKPEEELSEESLCLKSNKEAVRNLLGRMVSNLLERLGLSQGNEQLESKFQMEEKIISDFYPLVVKASFAMIQCVEKNYEEFMQKIETEIKEDKYNKEDNPLPIAFVKYWNLIHSTLFDETHLFNNIYFLNSCILYKTQTNPTESLVLGRQLVSLMEPLKKLLNKVEECSEKYKDLLKIEKVVESSHPITKSIEDTIRVEFKEAESLKIEFDEKCEIPSFSKTDELIIVKDLEKDSDIFVKQRLITTHKHTHNKNGIKIQLKITVEQHQLVYDYYGYRIIVKPKYIYKGFNRLKEILNQICWMGCYCGKKAYVIEKKEVEDKEKEKEYDSILNSKLLSGGLEEKHLKIFSKEKIDKMKKILAEFELHEAVKYLEEIGDTEEAEDETCLNRIIHGKHQTTDKAVYYLHKIWGKGVIWANAGGEEAAKIVRRTFAVLIKHSKLISDFQCLCDDIEFEEESAEENKEIEVEKVVIEKLKSSGQTFDNILKKYGAASKMRVWFSDKKKEIGEKKLANEEAEIMKILDLITQKVEFLIKLNQPSIWADKKEVGNTKVIMRSTTLTAEREKSIRDVSEMDLMKKRMGLWGDVQKSRGIHNIEGEDISSSLTSSVLSSLQSDISVKKLSEALEERYLQVILKMSSLKLFSIILENLPICSIRMDVVSWFSAAVKKNEKTSLHYAPDALGSGDFLATELRKIFFKVIQKILSYIPSTRKEEELKILLESIKWQYNASDHKFLVDLDIFNILRGLPNKESVIYKEWGKSLADDENKDRLSKDILDTYEFIIQRTIARALKQYKQKETAGGSTTGQLEKFHSLLSVSATEALFENGFKIVVEELEHAGEDYRICEGEDLEKYEKYQESLKREAEDKPLIEEKDKAVKEEENVEDLEEEKKDEAEGEAGSEEEKEKEKTEGEGVEEEKKEEIKEEEVKVAEVHEIEEKEGEDKKDEEKKETEDKKEEDEEKDEEKDEEDKKEKKEDEKEDKIFSDYYKEKYEFIQAINKVYNPQFCHRLLRIMHLIVCVSQENDIASSILPKLISPSTVKILIHLLNIGFPSHKYIIIKIFNLLIKICYKVVLSGITQNEQLPENPLTKDDPLLNYWFDFVSQIRKNIWTKQYSSEGNYTISCEIIEILKDLLENKQSSQVLGNIVKDALFNPKTEYGDLNTLEILFSIIGGEFCGLRKGTKGKTDDGIATIIGFTKSEEESSDSKKGAAIFSSLDPSRDTHLSIYHSEFSHCIFKTSSLLFNEIISSTSKSASFLDTLLHSADTSTPSPKQTLLQLLSNLQDIKLSSSMNLQQNTCYIKLLKCLQELFSSADNSTLLFKELNSQGEDSIKTFIKKAFDKAALCVNVQTNKSLNIVQFAIHHLRASCAESQGMLIFYNGPVCRVGDGMIVVSQVDNNTATTMHFSLDFLEALNLKRLNKQVFLLSTFDSIEESKQEKENLLLLLEKEKINSENYEKLKQFGAIITCGTNIREIYKSCSEIKDLVILIVEDEDYKELLTIEKKMTEISSELKTDLLDQFEDFGGFKKEEGEKFLKYLRSSGDLLTTLMKKDKEKLLEIYEKIANDKIDLENSEVIHSFIDSYTFKEMWTNDVGSDNLSIKEGMFQEYSSQFKEIFQKSTTHASSNYKLLLQDLEIFLWRHLLFNFIENNEEQMLDFIFENEMQTDLLKLVKLLSFEGLVNYYGFKDKNMKERVNSFYRRLLLNDKYGEGIVKTYMKDIALLGSFLLHHKETVKKCTNIFKSTENQLLQITSISFVLSTFKNLIKERPKLIFKLGLIGNIIEICLTSFIYSDEESLKYHILLILIDLATIANANVQEIEYQHINNILNNKLIKHMNDIVTTVEKENLFTSLWKEFMFQLYRLFKNAAPLYGENILSAYKFNLDILDLIVAYDIMKECPKFTSVEKLLWFKENKEIAKKSLSKIETMHSYFNTPCRAIIDDNHAMSLKLTFNKPSSMGDEHNCLLLYSINGKYEFCNKRTVESFTYAHPFNKLYIQFPVNLYTVYAFGSYEGGRMGSKKKEDFTHNPFIISELTGLKIKQFQSAGSHSLCLTDDGTLYASGEGLGKCGAKDAEEFTAHDEKIVMFGTSDENAIFQKQSQQKLWGEGKNADNCLGLCSGEKSSPNQLTVDIEEIKKISLSTKHTLLLSQDGKLFGASTRNRQLLGKTETSDEDKFVEIKIDKKLKVEDILATPHASILLCSNSESKKKELWSCGSTESPNPMLGQGKDPEEEIDFFKLKYPEELEFKAIKGNLNTVCAITNEGQLYMWGKNLKGQLGLFTEEGDSIEEANVPTHVKFFKDYEIVDISCGVEHTLVLAKSNIDQETKVFAFGETAKGKLGEKVEEKKKDKKDEKKEEDKKEEKEEDKKDKKEDKSKEEEKKEEKKEEKPKEEEKKEEKKEEEAKKEAAKEEGSEESKKKEETEEEKKKSEEEEKKEKKTYKIKHLDFFDKKNAYKIVCGADCSFVFCGTGNTEIIHECKCTHTNQSPIKETLHFSVNQPQESSEQSTPEFTFYSQDAIEELKDTLPPLIWATKNPISNIQTKTFPVLKYDDLIDSSKPLALTCTSCKNNCTQSAYSSCTDKDPLVLCEECFKKPRKLNLIPAIYLRITKPFKNDSQIPKLALADYYEKMIEYGLSIKVKPGYKSNIPKEIIDKNKSSFDTFLKNLEGFDKEQDLEILDLLNDHAMNDVSGFKDVKDSSEITLKFKTKAGLRKVNEKKLRRRLKLLFTMNKMIEKIIPSINFFEKAKDSQGSSLLDAYVKFKEYLILVFKHEIQKAGLDKLERDHSSPNVVIDRMRAKRHKDSGKVDHAGERTIFGQLFQGLKTQTNCFKKQSTDSRPFNLNFRGEGGIDAGGLFREALDEIVGEMQSHCLPMLVPTPNNKNSYGSLRDKWMINPSSLSSTHMELYEFLGALMGMSLRTSHLMPLELAPMVWKQILQDPLERSDLIGVDGYCTKCLDDIANIDKKGIDQTTFEGVVDQQFVTRLSDGTEVELKEDGKNIQLTFENRHEYIQLLEKVRLGESKKQLEAIRKGLL